MRDRESEKLCTNQSASTYPRGFTLAWIMLVVLGVTAEARLIETESELMARFGPIQQRTPKKTSFEGRFYDLGTMLRFRSEQWTIEALLIEGRCAQITYGKVGSWTDEQIIALLDRNGGSGTFQEERTGLGKSLRTWRQRDGVRADFRLNLLILTHPLHERQLAKLRSAAEAQSKRMPKF